MKITSILMFWDKKPDDTVIKKNIIYSLILTVIFYIMMFFPTETMQRASPYTIFDFQFALNSTRSKQILVSWNSVMDAVFLQTVLDLGFLVGYSLLLCLFTILITRQFPEDQRSFGYCIAWISLGSGFCDLIENSFTFWILLDPKGFPDYLPLIVGFFAILKFLEIIISVSFIFIGFIYLYYLKRKKP